MAKDNTMLLILLAIGGYFLYTKKFGLSPLNTAAPAVSAAASNPFLTAAGPSPSQTLVPASAATAAAGAPVDVGGIVMGPGY